MGRLGQVDKIEVINNKDRYILYTLLAWVSLIKKIIVRRRKGKGDLVSLIKIILD